MKYRFNVTAKEPQNGAKKRKNITKKQPKTFILKVFYGIIITGNNSIESLILSAFSGM